MNRTNLHLGLTLAALAGACTPAPDERPDVLFVLVDTLRADRLSFYGHDAETAPFLASLAAESLVFERAWAGSSWTAPSVASIFTGVLPPQHGVLTGFNAYGARGEVVTALELGRIPSELVTLPELFDAAGYRTYGIADNANVRVEGGFADGFGRFEGYDYRSAPAVNGTLAEWAPEIRAGDGPWFVYLHYMDTHGPYHKRAPYYVFDESRLEIDHSLAPPATREVDGDPWIRRYEIRQLLYRAQIASDAQEAARWIALIGEYLGAVYESEIRYLDDHLREAFELLGVDDATLVVFVSDHGEELGDHGGVGHEFQMYDELLRVPMFLRLPARADGTRPVGRIDDRVSTIDLWPTLARRIGAPLPEYVGGVDLVSYTGGEHRAARPVFGMRVREVDGQPTTYKDAVVLGDDKLIVSSPGDELELYDLANDPDERHDRAERDAETAARLRELLDTHVESLPKWTRRFVPVELDDEQRARIEELGYGGE